MKSVGFRLITPRVAGALRVVGLLVLLQVTAAALWLQAAHARAGEALLNFGAELMKLEGTRPGGGERTVLLNGVTVHLRSATIERSLHDVLDRFHAVCRERTGVQAPQAVLDKLAREMQATAAQRLPDGILRAETEAQGALACIDSGGRLSLADLGSRLQQFGRSGDLSAVGQLRYVIARRVEGKTAVLSLWTSGGAPLLQMFPASGDAPGRDPGGVPRAPGTRRLLSAWESGQPYSFAIYTAAGGTIEGLHAFYASELPNHGWVVDAARDADAASSRPLVARRGDQTVLVRVARDGHELPAISVAVLD